jgi:DNA segregation ATPase FtsK/SpoIIIE-like protein
MNISELLVGISVQHMAIVGRTGSGKTYAAKGAIVEPLLTLNRRVCIIDPTGVWWGLRSSADGKSAGFPIAVFGGPHADVPIVAGSAAALAELIAKHNVPAVIDLSEFLIGDRHAFMEEFAAVLYRDNRTPLHLVIDEADEFAPQNPLPETRRMLHRIDQIVRRGRVRGFRVMLITQRPAVLHKNVLTQANTLVAMRLTAPQDRKAIEDWIKGQADAVQGREVLNTLAKLQRGEGWVWAPEQDVLVREQFPRIQTFDSGRTPEDGQEIEQPTRLADVDLDAIRGSLEEAQREAEENDPKHLRARIRELEEQLDSDGAPAADPEALVAAEQRGYDRGQSAGLAEGYNRALEHARSALARLIPMQTEAGMSISAPTFEAKKWTRPPTRRAHVVSVDFDALSQVKKKRVGSVVS